MESRKAAYPSGRDWNLETVEMSKKFGPLPWATMWILDMFTMAGVAALLMCCQCGEVDQTLSLILLQPNGQVAAPSHTSACLDGFTDFAMHMSESCSNLWRCLEPVTGIVANVIEALDMPCGTGFRERMTLLHENSGLLLGCELWLNR
jgi:hypothetical protein